MYKVESTGELYSSFLGAVKAANIMKCHVIEVETGITRWSPAPLVSAKKMRMYAEKVAAHDAYKRMQAGV